MVVMSWVRATALMYIVPAIARRDHPSRTLQWWCWWTLLFSILGPTNCEIFHVCWARFSPQQTRPKYSSSISATRRHQTGKLVSCQERQFHSSINRLTIGTYFSTCRYFFVFSQVTAPHGHPSSISSRNPKSQKQSKRGIQETKNKTEKTHFQIIS